jgi:hypothetical protein
MFGGQILRWERKSKGDIIATMIAFVVLGSIIITGTLTMALRERSLLFTIWCGAGSCFVARIIVLCVRGGIAELRRRQRNMTQDQDQKPPT